MVGLPARVPGHSCLSAQTWMNVPSLESAPKESAPTLWAPSPARTANGATGPVPWATPVRVRDPSPMRIAPMGHSRLT